MWPLRLLPWTLWSCRGQTKTARIFNTFSIALWNTKRKQRTTTTQTFLIYLSCVFPNLSDLPVLGDPKSFWSTFPWTIPFKKSFSLKGNDCNDYLLHPPCDVVKEGFLSFTYLSFFLRKKHQKDFFAAGAETRPPIQTASSLKAAIFCACGDSILLEQGARARPSPDAGVI